MIGALVCVRQTVIFFDYSSAWSYELYWCGVLDPQAHILTIEDYTWVACGEYKGYKA